MTAHASERVPHSILITGASGFVGAHLVACLRKILPEATLHTDPFDITDPLATAEAVRSARPDRCIHLAAVAAIADARLDPDAAWRVNLHGTLHLARALLQYAPSCRLIHIGSADAYGASFHPGTPLDETAPLAPLNTYGATKAAADLALGAMVGEGLQLVRVRPFNHTGPGQREDFVVAAFARQIARIRSGLQPPLIKVGDLTPERDFLDVRDVVAAYAACARHPELPSGTLLNIASGVPRRIGDILSDLLRLAGIDPMIETDQARLRSSDIARAVGDATRAAIALDWRPTIPWNQTLADVLTDWQGREGRIA